MSKLVNIWKEYNHILKTEKIRIIFNEFEIEGVLTASSNVSAILSLLPFETTISTWGEEIYFEMPVETELGPDAKTVLAVGDIAFWPPGKCFCLFFGPTPASTDDRPVAASDVEVIGSFSIDIVEQLRKVSPGTNITIRKAT